MNMETEMMTGNGTNDRVPRGQKSYNIGMRIVAGAPVLIVFFGIGG
jgi:hypothetical protein